MDRKEPVSKRRYRDRLAVPPGMPEFYYAATEAAGVDGGRINFLWAEELPGDAPVRHLVA